MFDKKRKLRRLQSNFAKNRNFNTGFSTGRSYVKRLRKPQNPFFRKFKKVAVLSTVLGFILFFLYLITFSNYFLLKEITISSADKSDFETLQEQLNKKVSNQLGKNLFFLDLTEIEAQIRESYPEIEEVTLEKNYPSTVEITLTTYPLVANVINESSNLKKSLIINQIGYAVKEDQKSTALPYIRIKSDEPINPKNTIIEAKKLKYILDTIIYFQDKFGMKIQEVEYKKTAREIHLLTEKNFYIWLDIQVPFENQLKKLKKALVKLDIYNENLEYIDLRIAGNNGDKIIYKRR